LIEDDKLNAKKRDTKNAIESFIYATRNNLSDSSLSSYFDSAEKQTITKFLEESENWIIDESDQAQLPVLEEKLNQVKKGVYDAAPKFHQYQIKLDEERLKAKLEAEEYARLNPVNESTHKDRREPKTKGEKIEAAKKRKNQGTVLFKEGDYENAAMRYAQGVAFFDNIFDLSVDEKKEVEDLKLQSYLNLAACWLKLKKYEKARDNCTTVLKMEENNVKALFRRGQANYYLKDFDASCQDLTLANKYDPNNTEVKKILKMEF